MLFGLVCQNVFGTDCTIGIFYCVLLLEMELSDGGGGIEAAFAVVLTDKICGRSLSSKIPVNMNSIFTKLCHMTNMT